MVENCLLTDEQIIEKARTCMDKEIQAINDTKNSLDNIFVKIVHEINSTLKNGGKIVWCGVGKNLPICQKIIATFTSTGVPCQFIDPCSAIHGDSGMLLPRDLLFMMSNSGNTEELVKLIPIVKRIGTTTVAITSKENSKMAKMCDLTLFFKCDQEACPLKLCPTASTTACLALGDALAMVYIEYRHFTSNDFAKFHPGGSLGQLLLKVEEIAKRDEYLAVTTEETTILEVVLKIQNAKSNCAVVVDEQKKVIGIFTQKNLRDLSSDLNNFTKPVKLFMTKNPVTILEGVEVNQALYVLKNFENIKKLVVVDTENHPIGVLHRSDLPNIIC